MGRPRGGFYTKAANPLGYSFLQKIAQSLNEPNHSRSPVIQRTQSLDGHNAQYIRGLGSVPTTSAGEYRNGVARSNVAQVPSQVY